MVHPLVPALALPTAWVGVLGVVQALLLVAGVIVWSRTAPERFTLNRWLWLAIVVVLGIIGPVCFLAFGRRPAPVDQVAASPQGSADAVADLLYGQPQ